LSEREILVPDLGGFKDVVIIDVLAKAGDSVGPDTPLITLETEKATMDVPASASGVIVRMLAERRCGFRRYGDCRVAR
jgi:pyruvate dehydrogenase E2 component (dihydrolipoamide acetyltransferase)